VFSLSTTTVERNKSKRELVLSVKRSGSFVVRTDTEKECMEWIGVLNSFGMKIPEKPKKTALLSLKCMPATCLSYSSIHPSWCFDVLYRLLTC
jgi:hypothetical protein